MTSFGRTVQTPVAGVPIAALFNTEGARWKAGGITLDWSTVAQVSGSPVTLLDGQVVEVGNSYLRFGQVVSQISATGYYGPYDSAATDGRQRIARDVSFVLNETVVKNGPGGFTIFPTKYAGAFHAGKCWAARVLYSSGAHSLASGPTLAEFQAAFPMISFASTTV